MTLWQIEHNEISSNDFLKYTELMFNKFKIFRKPQCLIMLFVAAMLSACTSTPSGSLSTIETKLPGFNTALFEERSIVSLDQITQLDQDQKEAFLEFFNDPKFALTPEHTRVATYLGILLDQFTYSNKTYTAQQTLDNSSGNCLSLTVLSTALAQLVNVDIHYQLLDQNPVYSINDNLLITSDHLRAVLQSSSEADEGDISSVSYIRIDYFDTNGLSYVDKISVNTQKSLFYSNLAIENLANKKIDSAFAYAKKALDIYPDNASALNTMGILHRKRGDVALAEELYEFGARYYSKAPLFVRNYKSLLASQGREFDLQELVQAERKSMNSHPWEWVRAGKIAFNSGDYDDALLYYRKALVIAPDIRQIHLFAGQASLAAGKKRQSKQFFVDAYKLSEDTQDRQSYKGKLLALKGKLK